MEAIRAKEIQVSKLQKELKQLKFEQCLGQCFIRIKTNNQWHESVPTYIQITKIHTGPNHDNSHVDYIEITEKGSSNLTVKYFSYASIHDVRKYAEIIGENVFIDKVQKLMHRIPLLKQVQDRKRLEPAE